MEMQEKRLRKGLRIIAGIIVLIVIFGAIVAVVQYVISRFYEQKIGPSATQLVFASITLVAGYFLITIISRMLLRFMTARLGRARAMPFHYIFSLVAYLALAFIVFGELKLDLTGLIVGSAFTGIVLGLASQTVLSNLFAGLVIVLARPVKVGDRVTVATWQYSLIAPSYPPKFFSNDFLINGFTGMIDNIGFLYVDMTLDDKRRIIIPAGIFIQALVMIHSGNGSIKVRSKYEIEKSLSPDIVIEKVKRDVSVLECIVQNDPVNVYVQETTLNTYILAIDVVGRGMLDEPVRNDVLKTVMKSVGELRQQKTS